MKFTHNRLLRGSIAKVFDMDSVDEEQDAEGKRRNSGGELKSTSAATQASDHTATSTTHPTVLDRALLAASSSVQSALPSGIRNTVLLNYPSSVLNTTAMDALRLPIPSHLFDSAFMPSVGIPNPYATSAANSTPPAMQHAQLSELLHYFQEAHRSALFPYASPNLTMVNAVTMNHLHLSQLFEQQLTSHPTVSRFDAFVARGLTNGAFFQDLTATLPSLRLASEMASSSHSADLPSVSRPLADALLESTDSIMTRRLGVPSEATDVTQLAGGRDFFPMVLHRTLTELELVPGGSDIGAFLPDGLSFQIKDQVRFEDEILPSFFPRMKGFASFQRQLNLYDFRRRRGAGLDRRTYSHELFVRHHPEVTRRMRRTRVERAARSHASNDKA